MRGEKIVELERSIADLQSKLRKHREVLETEEAAKTTLVLPFLRALGYDIFDPSEVKPEFTCDVGTRKGEKVDYAICVNGDVSILIECKPSHSELSIKHAGQLFRYFSVTDAKVALLTNGVIYKFYTDADRSNRMDDKPFFTFDLDNYRRSDLKNLAAFQKSEFDLERIASQAGHLKLQSEVSKELRTEFTEPSDEFVRLIARRLHEGSLTEAVRERFRQVITHSIAALIREGVNERLENAMSSGEEEFAASSADPQPEVETTQVEIDGFNIVRAIGSRVVKPERIVIRDAKSYCAVLLDDNNRKTIARLHFNSETTRHLGLFNGKEERRQAVAGPIDIYQHADAILDRIRELDDT